MSVAVKQRNWIQRLWDRTGQIDCPEILDVIDCKEEQKELERIIAQDNVRKIEEANRKEEPGIEVEEPVKKSIQESIQKPGEKSGIKLEKGSKQEIVVGRTAWIRNLGGGTGANGSGGGSPGAHGNVSMQPTVNNEQNGREEKAK